MSTTQCNTHFKFTYRFSFWMILRSLIPLQGHEQSSCDCRWKCVWLVGFTLISDGCQSIYFPLGNIGTLTYVFDGFWWFLMNIPSSHYYDSAQNQNFIAILWAYVEKGAFFICVTNKNTAFVKSKLVQDEIWAPRSQCIVARNDAETIKDASDIYWSKV